MLEKITFKGQPLTLQGREIKPGDPAPNSSVTAQDLSAVDLGTFQGKIKILTTFPSLDTPVCQKQVREFNARAVNLSEDVVIVGISKDLPFAQGRFCQAEGIKNVSVLSDYKNANVGVSYGLLIKELGLLTRAVLIIDKSDIVRYRQVVEEVTNEPDFEAVFGALEQIVNEPSGAIKESSAKCQACEGLKGPITEERIQVILKELEGWKLLEGNKIEKDYKFKDFSEAKDFLDAVALIAQEQEHHPVISFDYNKLKIVLWTHSVKGLTENDFIQAAAIDQVRT